MVPVVNPKFEPARFDASKIGVQATTVAQDINTPNLDQQAASGVRLTDGHVSTPQDLREKPWSSSRI